MSERKRTDADRKSLNKYRKKCKHIRIRFYPADIKFYNDFRQRCEDEGLNMSEVIKDLIERWTYF